MKDVQLSLGQDNALELVFDDDMAYSWFDSDNHKQGLKDAIESTIDKNVNFRVRLNDTGKSREASFVDLQKIINIDIDIE